MNTHASLVIALILFVRLPKAFLIEQNKLCLFYMQDNIE